MNIFDYSEYRTALRDLLKEKKKNFGSQFSYERMAAVCRIQRTYLSAALNGRNHLNSDQVFAAATYLSLNDVEYAFLSDLHEYERSTNQKRKSILLNKIKRAQNAQSQTESHIEVKPTIPESTSSEYFLDPYAQLVHMFLTIERYRQKPDRIRSQLGISLETLHKSLKRIEDAGFIRKTGGNLSVERSSTHLPGSSALQTSFRNSTRTLSQSRLMQCSDTNKYSVSATFSSSEEARKLIHKEFLKFIKKAQSESQKFPSEDVYQLNFDLFSWSKD